MATRPPAVVWASIAALVVALSAFIGVGAAVGASSPAASTSSWWDDNNTSAPTYTVTFHEVGLPAGTNWSVVTCITWWCGDDGGALFNTSNTSSLTFNLSNGTYHYRVFPVNGNESTPDHGTFTVNGSAPAPIKVNFAPPPLYTVSFTETGLASGTNWSVLLFPMGSGHGCGSWNWGHCRGGDQDDRAAALAGPDCHHGGGGQGAQFASSNTSSISFEVPNGTYGYLVLNVPGYSIVGAVNGSINVSGASPAPVPVVFSTLETYPVQFVEVGLPNGTNWSVAVFGWGISAAGGFGPHHHHHHHGEHFGVVGTSSTTTIILNLTNGTYRYRVGWVDGFYSNDTFGSFVVNGSAPTPIQINFTAIPEYNVSFNESGLPAGTDWGVTVVGVGGHAPGVRPQHITLEHAARGEVSFGLPKGHYHFKVLPMSGWSPTRGSARPHFAVRGKAVTLTVDFHASGAQPHHGVSGSSRAGTSGLAAPRAPLARFEGT